MAALNFPASPIVGQTYTANGVTYKWDGSAWRFLSSSNTV